MTSIEHTSKLVRMKRLTPVLALSIAGLLASSCSSTQTSAPVITAAKGSVNCTTVASDLASIKNAQSQMTTANDATSTQIASFAAQIDRATISLGTLTQNALPKETTLWVTTMNQYAKQLSDGAKAGHSVDDLLMDAQSFNSAAYRNAAQAISAYLTSACPS